MAVKGVIIHNWCVKSPINLAMVIIYPSIYSPCSFLSASSTIIIIIPALMLHVAPEFPLSNTYSLLVTPLAFYVIKSERRTSCDQITLTNSDKAACQYRCKPLVMAFRKYASKSLCNLFGLLWSSPVSFNTPSFLSGTSQALV